MILPELEKLIRQIEVRRFKKIKTSRSGSIVSSRAGRGLDFKEVREYILGDDTRYIDWNVSSRMGELYVKEYHQENDRLIYLFLDQSSSMFTSGVSRYSKYFIGFQFLAFCSLLFLHGGDRIHVVTYSNQIHLATDTLKTKAQVYQILRKLYEQKPSLRTTDHLLPFWFLKNQVSRKSIAYIISDFACLPDLSFYKPMFQLHDLYGIRVFDLSELMQSEVFELFYVYNSENLLGGKFSSSFLEDEQKVKNFFLSNLLSLRTDENLVIPILRFLLK
jgi:uncharacterized protein (DUF58 family)